MAKAIYPGTFDPATNGHIDIVERAAKTVDFLTVAVVELSSKSTLFSVEERVEMFAETVLPLRDRRSLRVEIKYAEELSTEYERRTYEFEDVDVIVLEGIYLLKREFQAHYDRSVWIECGFETALERALARGQEGLPPDETIRDYRDIYNPAQEIHFQRDNPKGAATLLVNNDARLGAITWPE